MPTSNNNNNKKKQPPTQFLLLKQKIYILFFVIVVVGIDVRFTPFDYHLFIKFRTSQLIAGENDHGPRATVTTKPRQPTRQLASQQHLCLYIYGDISSSEPLNYRHNPTSIDLSFCLSVCWAVRFFVCPFVCLVLAFLHSFIESFTGPLQRTIHIQKSSSASASSTHRGYSQTECCE